SPAHPSASTWRKMLLHPLRLSIGRSQYLSGSCRDRCPHWPHSQQPQPANARSRGLRQVALSSHSARQVRPPRSLLPAAFLRPVPCETHVLVQSPSRCPPATNQLGLRGP